MRAVLCILDLTKPDNFVGGEQTRDWVGKGRGSGVQDEWGAGSEDDGR